MSANTAVSPRARTPPPADVRAASLRAVYTIWYRDILKFGRDRWRLVGTLAQPLLFLVVFGSGVSSTLSGGSGAPTARGGLSYTQFIYPGIIGMAAIFTAMLGGMSIIWDREFGFLKEVLVAPIDRASIALGKTLGSTTQAMAQSLIMLVLAPFVGVGLGPLTLLRLLPLIFLLAFALSAFGVALASLIRSMQAFQLVMNLLMMPIFFLSGALFSLGGLPGWLAVLTHLDPAAYGIDPLRRVILSDAGLSGHAVDQLGLSVNGHVLAIPVEAAILGAFGCVMLATAVVRMKQRGQ
jgi:ABC-2 type transport system permease protein